MKFVFFAFIGAFGGAMLYAFGLSWWQSLIIGVIITAYAILSPRFKVF